MHYFMYSHSVSQFLGGSSNLKAGCRTDAVHDAFDAICMSCIHNRSREFLRNFFHLRPVMVAVVRSLPPEPAVLGTRALRCTNRDGWGHG